jgi:hypothetical protein
MQSGQAESPNVENQTTSNTPQLTPQSAPIFAVVSLLDTVNQSPSINERQTERSDFVWYDDDNLWPQRMMELISNSSSHGSIYNTTAFMVAGSGFTFTHEDDSKAEEYKEWFLSKIGNEKRFRERIGKDLAAFDGFGIQLIYNRSDDKFSEILHQDFTTIRSGKPNKEGDVEGYKLSSNWEKETKSRSKDKLYSKKSIAIYDPEKGKADGKQLAYVMAYKAGRMYYPEPAYLGCVNAVKIDIALDEFTSNNLKVGFSAGVHVHVPANVADTDKADIKQGIKDEYTGTANAGNVVVTVGGGEAPKFTALPSMANSDIMQTTQAAVDGKIYRGWSIRPELANFLVANGLQSDSTALKEAVSYYMNSRVIPKQDLLTGQIEDILVASGREGAKVSIDVAKLMKFEVSAGIMLRTQTMDEVRKSTAGLDPMDDGMEPVVIDNKVSGLDTEK